MDHRRQRTLTATDNTERSARRSGIVTKRRKFRPSVAPHAWLSHERIGDASGLAACLV
jgi:hypothetical protein